MRLLVPVATDCSGRSLIGETDLCLIIDGRTAPSSHDRDGRVRPVCPARGTWQTHKKLRLSHPGLVMTMPNNRWRTTRSGVGNRVDRRHHMLSRLAGTCIETCASRFATWTFTTDERARQFGQRIGASRTTCRLIRLVHPQHTGRPKSGGSFSSTVCSSQCHGP